MKKLILFLCLMPMVVVGAILPDVRVVPWSAGVLGGIPTLTNGPSVTDYGAVADGVTDCAVAVSNALAACPNTAAVYFPPGTYYLASSVKVGSGSANKRGVFRGAGMGQTIIRLGMDDSTIGGFFFSGGNLTGSNTLASGYTKGSTVIVANATTGLSVGQQVEVGQSNDTSFAIGGIPSSIYFQAQANQITNISGTTISLLRPLYSEFSAGFIPWIRTYTAFCTNSGVENMTLTTTSNTENEIYFLRCMDCWVKGVEMTNYNNRGMIFDRCYRGEVRQCISHDSTVQDSSRYGLQAAWWTTDSLFEDNIVGVVSSGVFIEWGTCGNVVSYNYCFRSYTNTTLGVSFGLHGGAAAWNLFEGNVGNGVIGTDNVWGGSPLNTFARNWATCYSPGSPNGRNGLLIAQNSISNNLVGNILALPSDFGVVGNNPVPINIYIDSIASTINHGNFEFRTNTLIWDGTIADHTVPSSYYLSTKPPWFGLLAWPPIGPDISVCTNNAITNAPLIPAQARYYGISYMSPPVANITCANIGRITAAP